MHIIWLQRGRPYVLPDRFFDSKEKRNCGESEPKSVIQNLAKIIIKYTLNIKIQEDFRGVFFFLKIIIKVILSEETIECNIHIILQLLEAILLIKRKVTFLD